jgi:hypothetical protein
MKIHEILVESQLQEGPILNKIGSAVGKGVGALAKGVGAVAGGVAGLGTAVKKGFQAGKATVGGADDDAEPATTDNRNILQKVRDTMPGSKPTATTAATDDNADQTTQNPPATTTKAPAQKKPTSAFGKLSAAANSGGSAPAEADPKADTAYAQAQKAIASLQPEQKKEIVTMLQADPKVKAAMNAKPTKPDPAAQARIDAAPQGYDGETGKPNAAPAPGKTDPAAAEPTADPGAGAMGNMVGQLAKGGTAEPNTMANAPVSKTNTAKPGNPNAAPAEPTAEPQSGGKLTAAQQAAKKAEILGKRAAGQTAGTTGSGFGNYVKKASGERIVGANKDGSVRSVNIKASKINTGNNLSETLADKIEAERKRIMGPTPNSVLKTRPALAEGFSLFRKR